MSTDLDDEEVGVVVRHRPCELCGNPLMAGQWHFHLTCCAAAGGLARRNRPCKPWKFKDGDTKIDGCAHCYLGGT